MREATEAEREWANRDRMTALAAEVETEPATVKARLDRLGQQLAELNQLIDSELVVPLGMETNPEPRPPGDEKNASPSTLAEVLNSQIERLSDHVGRAGRRVRRAGEIIRGIGAADESTLRRIAP